MIWLFVSLSILFAITTGICVFFLVRFARIIMIFEDDLSDTINTLNDVEDSIKHVLEMQMFFDSPEVQKAVQNILEEVKLCRLSVAGLIQKFTQRSKRQYVWVTEPDFEESFEGPVPRMPGQPPGTPNPLEIIRNEGIPFDVWGKRQ